MNITRMTAALAGAIVVIPTAVVATSGTAGASGAAGAPGVAFRSVSEVQRAASPCGRIARCRQVAATDVDGDARIDRIGWVQHSKKLVAIRVTTASGATMSRRINVEHWPDGGAWAGAARVDGIKGRELLVGSSFGAHTPIYTMLTHRRGELVLTRSPRGDNIWYVDQAFNTAFGWWRSTHGGEVRMTEKAAYGRSDRTFAGRNTTFAWRSGRWVKLFSTRKVYATPRQAYRIAGWHVVGLAEFPGY